MERPLPSGLNGDAELSLVGECLNVLVALEELAHDAASVLVAGEPQQPAQVGGK